ncbi:MAG: alanine racemase [Gammaproteobacteria bacterium]|nr:alanine racemase [Gammaproteobacteria bacterium]
MTRPVVATIDTRAFIANYLRAKALAPGARALAVVKANAYGHGAVALARALGERADGYGVACIEEAIELREAGVRRPVVLLEGVFAAAELTAAAAHELTVAVHSLVQLEWLERAQLARPLQVWLKIDTGMHRLGFNPDRVAHLYTRLRESDNVDDIVLMTHFSRADETEDATTARQLAEFVASTAGIDAPLSLANSAGLMAWPETHRDWVRPGIMLYGSSPLSDDDSRSTELIPVMRLESQLIAIRELAPGEAIGYGGRFVCDRPTRVGTVAIGYADGYPRHAPDGTPVLVNGRRSRLIGRVSMDMITVDLNDQPNATIGDPVQLWGDQISANEVARHCGTIAYELFTRITRRVHLEYV